MAVRKRRRGSGGGTSGDYVKKSVTLPQELSSALEQLSKKDPQHRSISAIVTDILEEKVFKTADDLQQEKAGLDAIADLEGSLSDDSAKGSNRNAGGHPPNRKSRRDTP